jgi:hypothetical protein
MKHVITILVLLLGATTFAADPHAGHGMAKPDRKSEQGVVSLDVAADGDRVHLLLATRGAGTSPALSYLTSRDGGEKWSDPVIVGAGQPAPEPAHRGMDAQIAARGDRVAVVWTTEGKEDRFGRGPMASAYSSDGGKTWHAGPNPADDGATSGHAFIDVAADDRGVFHLVWLDGREPAPTPTAILASSTTRPSPGKGLRYARSTDGGATWSANVTIDPQTCECCWNTLLTGPDGRVYVLYRDASPRDMALARSDDAGLSWSKPAPVGAFGWDVAACPHVGGGLALGASPDEVFASVWTAKDNAHHGAYTLRSRDAGATWTRPRQLGTSDSWHTDLVSVDGDRVVATWDAYVEGGQAIYAASSADGGRTWTSAQRLSDQDVSATHPRVIATPAGARVFWTQRATGAGSQWTSKLIPFAHRER